ncbi:hypothetical protein PCASD_11601 [Puccinia coronata f. sp. avenae]|uniref:Uncharacterized protein n=1 Tax=Puccinia coronata f. sp. avenae TaxID=200324 RepID=A0A2N5U8Q6_9BASI|nr:hypothetical protein PCASD_11601 [Puccinia coronata f. sp. avenae]
MLVEGVHLLHMGRGKSKYGSRDHKATRPVVTSIVSLSTSSSLPHYVRRPGSFSPSSPDTLNPDIIRKSSHIRDDPLVPPPPQKPTKGKIRQNNTDTPTPTITPSSQYPKPNYTLEEPMAIRDRNDRNHPSYMYRDAIPHSTSTTNNSPASSAHTVCPPPNFSPWTPATNPNYQYQYSPPPPKNHSQPDPPPNLIKSLVFRGGTEVPQGPSEGGTYAQSPKPQATGTHQFTHEQPYSHSFHPQQTHLFQTLDDNRLRRQADEDRRNTAKTINAAVNQICDWDRLLPDGSNYQKWVRQVRELASQLIYNPDFFNKPCHHIHQERVGRAILLNSVDPSLKDKLSLFPNYFEL